MAEIHVLMATYNGERYLTQQLDSILAQTYADWCLYISDDGSTDDTLKIIHDYHSRYPNQVKILSEGIRHGGAKANFGYLLEQCPEAQYYMFADQDDVWFPQKLETMLRFTKQQEDLESPMLTYCMLQVVNEKLEVLGKTSDFALLTPPKNEDSVLQYNYIPGCTMLFNHALRVLVGRIPEEAVMHDWWLLLCAHYMGKIICYDGCLQSYRQYGDNVSGTKRKKGFGGMILTVFREGMGKIKRVLDFEAGKLLLFYAQNKSFYQQYQEFLSPKAKQSFGIWFSMFEERSLIKKTIMYWRNFQSETIMITVYDWIAMLLRFPQ